MCIISCDKHTYKSTHEITKIPVIEDVICRCERNACEKVYKLSDGASKHED